MHRETADRLGPRVALRWKRYGLYHDFSWDDYRGEADGAAAGLIALGVKCGDRIGILAENRLEWLVTDIAILSAGAADVPMHAPLSAQQVEYQLGHSESRGVFVSGQCQAEKVLAALPKLPRLEWMISFDPVDVAGKIRHLAWDALRHLGRRSGAQDEVLRREKALSREDLATIIYTSGTTGPPKGVMLSHGNLLANALATRDAAQVRSSEILLSWLPYSHIYARTVDHYLTIGAGATVCLAESLDSLVQNLAEVEPTWMTAVPRFYEKVWSAVEHLPPDVRAERLKRMFGSRIWQLTSGGAPLPRRVNDGFLAAGLPLLEGYGLTECSPSISFNRQGAHKPGTVGQAIPNLEIKIAADGEILVRGPHVMMGYWKNPEATRETIVDGWLHTGDVGHLDADGYLTITDRKKDLIITSGGKNVAPVEIESLLTADPCIDQAVVYGDCKPFVSALIVPDRAALEAKAAELGCQVDVNGDVITSPRLHAFFAERIERLMQAVSNPERVKAFVILAQPFRVDTDELTPTLKLRRRHILGKYAEHLEKLYQAGAPESCH
jgi:long-chain acyl-CoA synthetase